MSTSVPQGSSRDRVAADPVLAELVERLTARLQAGDAVDVDSIAVNHPEYADRLRQLVPALEVLADLGRSSPHEAPPSGPEPLGELGVLGDYRIVREVGRGGMGVVYEARQLSLNRRVALKVLPFAAALDPRQLQRFHNEAQAAAGLHHTQIVPVFAVGVERGVHYYAMQFIEGRPLSEVIRALRPLDLPEKPERATPDKAASRPPSALLSSGSSPTGRPFFEAVARLGIQAADALEYAHSLGVVHRDIKPANLLLDTRGEVWVTDFGLARIQAEAGLTLTLTGDVLGTLRYMSPEQALGSRALVDHRSDVYSLGVTLYELLTLQPAVGGSDRQEILRRIAFEEPAPPRRINPEVPRELETILLKAMAKEPESRYAMAQDLADDLGRFLEHKPIRAKRPTLRERAVKWSRRHTALVRASVVGLALAALGLLIATVLATSAYRREAQQRQLAQAQRLRAEANFRRAHEAVDQMLTAVSQESLGNIPQAQAVRRGLLEKAAAFYREFVAEPASGPALIYESAQAYSRLALVEAELGHRAEAIRAHERQIALLDELLRGEPGHPRNLRDLHLAHSRLGRQLRANGDSAGALAETGRSVEIAQSLADRFPRDPANHQALARSLYERAMVLQDASRMPEAEADFNRSVEMLEQLVRENPDVGIHTELALALNNLGGLRSAQGRHAEAVAILERAIVHQKEVLKSKPHDEAARSRLQSHYENLAIELLDVGKPREALEAAHEIITTGEELVAAHPQHPAHRHDLADSYDNLASILKANNRLSDAEASSRRAIDIGAKLAAEFPNMVEARLHLVKHLNQLGLWLAEGARFAQARDAHQRALAFAEALLSDFPDRPSSRQQLAEASNNLAWLLATCPDPRMRDPAGAVRLAGRATELDPENGSYWDTLGVAHYRLGDWDAALRELGKSLELNRGDAVDTWEFLAMAHWKKGNLDQARQWYDKSVAWIEKNRPKGGELLRFRDEASALLGLTGRHKPAETKKENSPQRSTP